MPLPQAWLEAYADAKNAERQRELVNTFVKKRERVKLLLGGNIWFRAAAQWRDKDGDAFGYAPPQQRGVARSADSLIGTLIPCLSCP